MSEKNTRFGTRREDVFDILEDSVGTDLSNINAAYKYTVKVGNKFAYRSTNSQNRYELKDQENFFYSEVQAQECFRFFKNKGAVLNKIPT